MTAPSFLNTDFAYLRLTGVTDVQSIMDALLTMLETTLTATPTGVFPTTQRWSTVSGTIYKSAVDARGRYGTVELARTTITRLRLKVSDPSGQVHDGEVDIAGAGSTVDLYAGPGHLWVECNNAGTWETFRFVISDPTPEALDSGSAYVWCASKRDGSTGSQWGGDVGGSPDNWAGRYAGGSALSFTFTTYAARPQCPIADTTNSHLLTEAGSDVVTPLGTGVPSDFGNTSVNNFYSGKMYQAICVDAGQAAGAIIPVPIDTGVTGNFKVLGLAVVGSCRVAVRVP